MSEPCRAVPAERCRCAFPAVPREDVVSNLGRSILPGFKPVIHRGWCTRGTATTTELNCALRSDLWRSPAKSTSLSARFNLAALQPPDRPTFGLSTSEKRGEFGARFVRLCLGDFLHLFGFFVGFFFLFWKRCGCDFIKGEHTHTKKKSKQNQQQQQKKGKNKKTQPKKPAAAQVSERWALIERSRWLQSVAASQRSRCWSRGRGLPGRCERSRRADERPGAPLQL